MGKAHLGEGIRLGFIAQFLIEAPGRLTGMQNDLRISPFPREGVGIVHEFPPEPLTLNILPNRQLAHLDASLFIQWLENKAGHQFGSLSQGKVEGILLPDQFRRVVGEAKGFAQDFIPQGNRLFVFLLNRAGLRSGMRPFLLSPAEQSRKPPLPGLARIQWTDWQEMKWTKERSTGI